MKLLICDYKNAQSFSLPSNVSNTFMINFKFTYKDTSFNETLTFKANDMGKWIVCQDSKVSLMVNSNYQSQIIVEEKTNFYLKYSDIPELVSVYVLPDFCDFIPYSISNVDKILIGSTPECNIKYNKDVAEYITMNRNGFDWYVDRSNLGQTSTYINYNAYDNYKLKVGDIIFINGIKILYMRDFILLNSFSLNLGINSLSQINDEGDVSTTGVTTPVNEIEKNVKLFNDDQTFVHTPRLKNEIMEEVVIIDAPPEKSVDQRTPLIFSLGSSAIMSLVSATSLLNSFRSYQSGQGDKFSLVLEMVTFGAMLVTGLLLPFLMEKWERFMSRRREKKRQKKYVQYLNLKIEEVNSLIKKQEEILKLNNTSLEQIQNNIVNHSVEIWSREIFDGDFLTVNIGIGNIPAKIKIDSSVQKKFSLQEDKLLDKTAEVVNMDLRLNDVPVSFSITEHKIMPVVIGSKYSDDFIMSVMLQLIYYHSGNDLKIAVITNKYNADKWKFMRSLPHNWDDSYEKRFFVTNEDELLDLSMYLEKEYDNRTSSKDSSNKNEKVKSDYKSFDKYYLIVTDDYKLAREMPLLDKIIDSDENLGFSLIIFEKSLKNLPSKFESLVNIRDEGSCIVERSSVNSNQNIFAASFLPNLDIEKYARIIANIPLSIKSADSAIPSSLTFLDMFYAGSIEQLNVLSRWERNNPTISLKSILGFKENDKPIELDLHEKYHGPHGLIAGSTGSGKSEFIITYILSMAVNYHPYEVQFVLIDYKGGGLAGAFENRESGVKIPHLVGTITNLDKSEMGRTLVSINSELQRRQRVFNKTRESLDEGTIDIYKYQRLYREGKVKEPMSHLFIIADEFAELKAQQPDFMDELVSTARIGRSLGVHLILATQKPSGVVDDQIWSNTRFRICLKVQTTEDSSEMLKKPDAAYIKQSGRFYLQVGNDEIYELGQSGWAGAKYVPSDNVQKKVVDNIEFLSNSGESLKIINEEVKKEDTKDLGEQLPNIVKYLYDIAKKENIKFSKLWLDNIPEILYYDNIIKKYDIKASSYLIEPVIGEYDDPSNQKQGYVTLPLSSCGNTYIAGVSGSGKSSLISVIVYSTIINHSPSEVNIYIVDLGAEKLRIFQKAPQVGDVLTSADSDKIKYLFYMLNDEKERRFAYYSENGGDFSKDIEKKDCPFPTILVIINEFEVFKELYEDLFDYDFVPFTRNCAKVGITMIVTSTQTGSLGYMAESNFPKKIILNLQDTSEYQDFFKDSPIPKKNAGRGVIEIDNAYEFQIPLIFDDSTYDKKINFTLKQLSKYLIGSAPRVPVIPEEVTLEMLKPKIKNLSSIPLGVSIKTAQIGLFNFSNLLNVISASDNATAKRFFPKLMEILHCVPDLRIIVINSLKDFSFEVPDGVKYCDSGFKKILKVVNENVLKCQKEEKNVQFLIIFTGYIGLQQHLNKDKEESEEDIVTINDLITNSKTIKNFKYVLYDLENKISKIEDEPIDSLFKRNNGIWLGKSFDSQDIFESNQSYTDLNITNNNITIIKNGNVDYLKF